MVDYKEMYRIMFRGSEKAQLDSEDLYLLAEETLIIDQENTEATRQIGS